MIQRSISKRTTMRLLPDAGLPITVRYANPSTAGQRARLVRTQTRLRAVHFSPEDDTALKLLQSVRQSLPWTALHRNNHRRRRVTVRTQSRHVSGTCSRSKGCRHAAVRCGTTPAACWVATARTALLARLHLPVTCVAQAAFQARHGSDLLYLRGVRLLCRRERAALRAAELEPADREVFSPRPHNTLSLQAYSSFRTVSLCRVFAGFTSCLPALPTGLREVTFDSGPGLRPAPSMLPNSMDSDEEEVTQLDLRHLTALTRLTLVRLKQSLCDGLLGTRRDGPARLPPQLETLRAVEPASPGGHPSLVNLGDMLRWSRPALPPACFPALHVRADEVICGPVQPWPAHVEPALPREIRIQTRCLSLSPPGSRPLKVHRYEPSDSGSEIGWYTAADAQRVHPVAALCAMLRSLPAGVRELGLMFAKQQPLRLQLQWHLNSWMHSHGAQTCRHEVSFESSADVADSIRQTGAGHGMSVQVVADGGDYCVTLSRILSGAAAVQKASPATAVCHACMQELWS